MRVLSIVVSLSVIALPAPASGNPWFGTWKVRLDRPADKPETLICSDAGGGAMRMVSVEDRCGLVTRFDGKPVKNATRAATVSSPPR